MPSYWFSCSRFTVQVDTDGNGTIVGAAPIVRKFVGQPVRNLIRWARAMGGLRIVKLKD